MENRSPAHASDAAERSGCRRCSSEGEFYRYFLASGARKSEPARRMGLPKANLSRLFDLRHRSRLDQIEAAFRALGEDLRVEVRPAA